MKLEYVTVAATLAGLATATDNTNNANLVAQLKTAATKHDAQALLSGDSSWTFDFKAQPGYTYNPGSVVNANAASFPAAVGNGMTMAMLNLGPCAMLPPHYHPRATNYVVAVEGETTTYMIQENGAPLVTETLTPGKMTIFPAASLHSMQNNKCTNATLVSALNSEDAGTHNVVNGIFGLPSDIVYAAFGYYTAMKDTASFSKLVPGVGTGSVMGSAACKQRCGLA